MKKKRKKKQNMKNKKQNQQKNKQMMKKKEEEKDEEKEKENHSFERFGRMVSLNESLEIPFLLPSPSSERSIKYSVGRQTDVVYGSSWATWPPRLPAWPRFR